MYLQLGLEQARKEARGVLVNIPIDFYQYLLNKGRCPKKKRENVGMFPKWGTLPPPPCLGMTRLFDKKNHGLFCILGEVSHVKNSKKMEVGLG